MRTHEKAAMFIGLRSQDDIILLDLRGRLGVENGGALYDVVCEAMNSESRNLVLNLCEVTALDAAGLGELASVCSFVRAKGGTVRLVLPCTKLRELLARTNLLEVLPAYPDEAAAIASAHSRRARALNSA